MEIGKYQNTKYQTISRIWKGTQGIPFLLLFFTILLFTNPNPIWRQTNPTQPKWYSTQIMTPFPFQFIILLPSLTYFHSLYSPAPKHNLQSTIRPIRPISIKRKKGASWWIGQERKSEWALGGMESWQREFVLDFILIWHWTSRSRQVWRMRIWGYGVDGFKFEFWIWIWVLSWVLPCSGGKKKKKKWVKVKVWMGVPILAYA